MKSKLLLDKHGQKIYALVFDKGDEVSSGLLSFAKEKHLSAAHFSAVGAFSDVTLGYFDWDKKEYKKIPLKEQVEVLALTGDIAEDDKEPEVHAHVVVGKSDGTAHGGHLLEAHVRPTLEVIIEDTPEHLRRKIDKETHLALISI